MVPTYAFDTPFAIDLHKRVRKAMGARSWYAPTQFWVRTFFILALTTLAEVFWVTRGTWQWGLAVGVLHAMIGLSVQHDASHGAVSRSPWVNALLAHGADIIGNSRWIWYQQHVLWHHPYTNHLGLDGDAESAEPALLFHDYTTPPPEGAASKHPAATWLQPFQHLYMHAVLALYGPSMTLNMGYLKQLRHNDNVPDALFAERDGFYRQQRSTALLFRAAYFLRVVLLPWYVAQVPLLVGLFYVSGVCGTLLTLLFVVSHNFEGSDRAPSKAQAEGPIDWYKAQIESSSTYGGQIGMVLTGGLNLQIEHHCFPRLSSWHYPAIQEAVKECCKEHGVHYAYFPSLWSNLRSCWRYMRKVGIVKVLKHAVE